MPPSVAGGRGSRKEEKKGEGRKGRPRKTRTPSECESDATIRIAMQRYAILRNAMRSTAIGCSGVRRTASAHDEASQY